MATLEVRIKYETIITRTCFWTLTLLSPIWFMLPICFVLFFLLSNKPGSDITSMILILYATGVFPLLIVGTYLWFFFRDNQLVISQQGICFPSSLLSLIFRRNKPWYKLSSVSVVGDVNSNEYRDYSLVLHYADTPVKLSLRYLKPNDVEQLFLGVETFGVSASGIEKVGELKKLVKSELKIAGIKSYTNLWDDELSYRYSSTTFIPLAPGSTLQNGEIKVLRQLGFGGLSAIYLVQLSQRNLAILKESVLPADVDDVLRNKAEEQFKREAQILAGLSHPQIAKVMDHFVERGHYLLLEYIHGQDLRQLVNAKGKIPDAEVLKIALQIAEILNYLHNRLPSIIHRDLTPENLIVNDSGKIILIDFGAANEFLHTATGTLVGKHAYMAPEQLKGKTNTQSDIYALGCTLHFLLTGVDPIPLASSHPRALNESVSEATDQLVFDLTRYEVQARYQSATEVASRIQLILKDGGV